MAEINLSGHEQSGMQQVQFVCSGYTLCQHSQNNPRGEVDLSLTWSSTSSSTPQRLLVVHHGSLVNGNSHIISWSKQGLFNYSIISEIHSDYHSFV